MRRPRPYTTVEQPAPVTVIIPYTEASEKLQFVIDCLRIQQVQPELHRVGHRDEYWQLLHDRWEIGDEFLLVEQDVVVWQGAIQHLAECSNAWCTLPTMCHGRMITTTFGCVKFSRDLIARNPRFWDDIDRDWFHLDANFADKMGWPWIRPHDHWPPASHLNEVQWADEISTRFALERKLVWQAHEAGEAVARVKYRTPEDDRPWYRRRRSEHVGVARVERESLEVDP